MIAPQLKGAFLRVHSLVVIHGTVPKVKNEFRRNKLPMHDLQRIADRDNLSIQIAKR